MIEAVILKLVKIDMKYTCFFQYLSICIFVLCNNPLKQNGTVNFEVLQFIVTPYEYFYYTIEKYFEKDIIDIIGSGKKPSRFACLYYTRGHKESTGMF